MKTKLNHAEARAAAFKEFPAPTLRSSDTSDFIRNDINLAELVHAYLNGGAAWVEVRKDSFTNVKPTKRAINARIKQLHEAFWEKDTLAKWMAAKQFQRYQVDSSVWYEYWGGKKTSAKV